VTRSIGTVLALLWAGLAWQKYQTAELFEMLWMCHVAAAMLALGLMFNWRRLSAVGFLHALAVGIPIYALHLLAGGATSFLSMCLHVLTPALGAYAWRGRALPRSTAWWGVICFAVVLMLSRVFTPEVLNINVAFRPWAPLAFLGPWLNWVGNMLTMVALLHGGAWLLHRRQLKPRF
jgi:hypothetical protein